MVRVRNRPLYLTSVGYADELFCLNNFPLLFLIGIQGKGNKVLKGEQDDLFKPEHKQIKVLCANMSPYLCADGKCAAGFQCWGGLRRDTMRSAVNFPKN